MTYSAPSSVTDRSHRSGTYTGSGAAQSILLGFAPRYIHIVNLTGAGVATRRGGFKMNTMSSNTAYNHDGASSTGVTITATGFDLDTAALFNNSGDTYTYFAIG